MANIPLIIQGGVVLMATGAWNEASKSVIGYFWKGGDSTVAAIIYAVLVTIIAIVIIYFVNFVSNNYASWSAMALKYHNDMFRDKSVIVV